MVAKAGHFSPSERAREKHAARERDERALRSGAVSAHALNERNDFFAALDISQLQIVAIGGRPLRAG
jgi:hypothetical protein